MQILQILAVVYITLLMVIIITVFHGIVSAWIAPLTADVVGLFDYGGNPLKFIRYGNNFKNDNKM